MSESAKTPDLIQKAFEQILESLDPKERRELLHIVENEIQRNVEDLWEVPEHARTHWILLLNGLDNEDERSLCTEILLWKHLSAKDLARVSCYQTSDRERFMFAC